MVCVDALRRVTWRLAVARSVSEPRDVAQGALPRPHEKARGYRDFQNRINARRRRLVARIVAELIRDGTGVRSGDIVQMNLGLRTLRREGGRQREDGEFFVVVTLATAEARAGDVWLLQCVTLRTTAASSR